MAAAAMQRSGKSSAAGAYGAMKRCPHSTRPTQTLDRHSKRRKHHVFGPADLGLRAAHRSVRTPGAASRDDGAPPERQPPPDSQGDQGAAPGTPGDAPAPPEDGAAPSSPWPGTQQRVLQLSATYSKTDPHYLQIKDRSKWWKRGQFPKIPHDDPDDDKIKDQPIKLWKKVVPLALIFFCSSFNLTILQAMKDAIVVTSCGAEALPFLASFVVLPASVAFFAYYSRIVSTVAKQYVYYLAIAPFIAFYAAFAAFVFPIADSLHLHGLFAAVAPHLPQGLHGMVRIVEHWSFALFFCAAELWGSVVIAVLFWGTANEVCTVKEARTVYPLMGISANVALVAAGNYMKHVNGTLLAGASTDKFVYLMVSTIVACSGVMGLTKLWIDRAVLHTAAGGDKPKRKKEKGSFKATLDTLKASPKILNLTLLVVCYAVAHRLFEFAWKGQLRLLFPTTQAYSGALADVSIYTGYATIALMLSGKFVFEYLGWGTAALATPIIMLAAGAAFFGLSLAAVWAGADSTAALLGAGALAGALTQVFARSSKFSLFDPAKEMVYISMSGEEKSKGKAAVDLMGSQAGKSGASWVIQGALIVLGSAAACLPVLAAVYLAVIGTWVRAALALKGLMTESEALRSVDDPAKGAEPEGGGAAGGNGVGAGGTDAGVGKQVSVTFNGLQQQ